MKTFWKIAPWITRLILAPPTVIFALIAMRYILNPATAAATVGITLTTPLAATILRIGFGAFPLGFSIFTLLCLISSRRILIGLGFVSIMLGVALGVRIFGTVIDGTLRESVSLIASEAVLLLLSLTGILIESHRLQIKEAVHPA
jgi:hypothetical protein